MSAHAYGVLSATLPIMWWINLALTTCLPQALITFVQAQSYDLSQLNWTLRNANGSIVIPAKIPSQVHLDLMEAGVVTEPVHGINGASFFFVLPTVASRAHNISYLLLNQRSRKNGLYMTTGRIQPT